jgi:hypothetical protein
MPKTGLKRAMKVRVMTIERTDRIPRRDTIRRECFQGRAYVLWLLSIAVPTRKHNKFRSLRQFVR